MHRAISYGLKVIAVSIAGMLLLSMVFNMSCNCNSNTQGKPEYQHYPKFDTTLLGDIEDLWLRAYQKYVHYGGHDFIDKQADANYKAYLMEDHRIISIKCNDPGIVLLGEAGCLLTSKMLEYGVRHYEITISDADRIAFLEGNMTTITETPLNILRLNAS